jgi:spore coat protein U-like protein
MQRNNKRWGLACAAAAVLVSGSALAANATGTLAVSATVLKSCIVVTTPVVFGTYDPTLGSATQTSGTVVVTCTAGTPYTIALGPGGGTGATVALRKLSLLTNTLNYGLFSNSGYSTVWGDTVGTNTVAGTAPLTLVNTHTVYASIPNGQGAALGDYLDTVAVTVAY